MTESSQDLRVMRLDGMKVGSCGEILSLEAGCPVYRQRLLAMGLVPGTVFQIVRIAPLGDPVEISFRGTSLCLRKHEAGLLVIGRVAT